MSQLALLLALHGGPLQGTPYTQRWMVGATAEVHLGPRWGVQLQGAWLPSRGAHGLSELGETWLQREIGLRLDEEVGLASVGLRYTAAEGELSVLGALPPSQLWLSAGVGAVVDERKTLYSVMPLPPLGFSWQTEVHPAATAGIGLDLWPLDRLGLRWQGRAWVHRAQAPHPNDETADYVMIEEWRAPWSTELALVLRR